MMWVGCRDLSIIFKLGTSYVVLKSQDQTHGLEVKSACLKEIMQETELTQCDFFFLHFFFLPLAVEKMCICEGEPVLRASPCSTPTRTQPPLTTRLQCLPHSLSSCSSQPSGLSPPIPDLCWSTIWQRHPIKKKQNNIHLCTSAACQTGMSSY